MSYKFINRPEQAVDEYLDGVCTSNLHLFRHGRVVCRKDFKSLMNRNLFTILTGGGSGHEPCFVGYIGHGMLTAAVCGNVFASPSCADILSGLKIVGGKAGVLVPVLNYTGDRLHFGAAVAQAKTSGIPVEMIIVDDDASLDGHVIGARGLCGMVLVLKVAGALAEKGVSLQNAAEHCRDLLTRMRTIGFSLSGVSLPGGRSTFDLKDGEMELGLGIHGEPGVCRVPLTSANDAVKLAFDWLFRKGPRTIPVSGKKAVLVNGLGGTSVLELGIIADSVRALLPEIDWMSFGTFMSSLDMHGVSITVLSLKNDVERELLDFSVVVPSWPNKMTSLPAPDMSDIVNASEEVELLSPAHSTINEPLKNCLVDISNALIKMKETLNELDADGDCGTSICNGASSILENVDTLSRLDLRQLCLNISKVLEKSMGGSFGALLSILFASGAAGLSEAHDGRRLHSFLKSSLPSLSMLSGAQRGYKSFLDPLYAILDLPESSDWNCIYATAKRAAEETANMKSKVGRSAYIKSTDVSKIDPGALAVSEVFRVISVSSLVK